MHGWVAGHEVPLGKNSPIHVRDDWGGLLKVFNVVLFWVLGPKLGSEVTGPRFKVQV